MTFTTDFGTGSPLVAAMKGVVLAGCPQAVLVDVSNEVPRFDVSAGAFMLFAGTRHFAGGSVHLAVVDPGVGSTRRRLIVEAGGRFYIGPDNGLFAIVIDEGEDARVLPQPDLGILRRGNQHGGSRARAASQGEEEKKQAGHSNHSGRKLRPHKQRANPAC